MSSSTTRIGGLGVVFVGAAAVVLVHLFVVMVVNHEVWAARSHQNRWAFRSVPSLRGALLDRQGRVLRHDEPTMQVSLYYLRFRLRHPVGAAVHGATAWARLQPGRELATYSYRDGRLGPAAAARDLLAMPVAVFRRGVVDKDSAAALATAVTTLLSTTTGMPRRKVYTALRAAAEEPRWLACGEALPEFEPERVLAEYDRVLAALLEFDRVLLQNPEMQRGSLRPGLIERLEWLRRASLGRRALQWTDEDGELHDGELYETMEWPVAEFVPFDLAAALQVGLLAHPGLRVEPGVQRLAATAEDSALAALLGLVREVGRAEPEGWMRDYVARELPERWLDDIVPEEAAFSLADRERMQQDAERSFARLTRRFERRGTAGFEAAFDGELSGRLGIRLVERDSQQKEQLMWSSLRVESGADVRVSIDTGLQDVAEAVVGAARERALLEHGDIPQREAELVQAALAVIDAQSGDVLAFAGAPSAGRTARTLPGLTWQGNGALGSVVKPFVLIEQLLCETDGRGHRALADLEACSGRSRGFRYGGRTLSCDSDHWEEGRDPVAALAKSCNMFFYQVGIGLQRDGLMRAYQRFGLEPAPAGSEFAACWQARVSGIPWASPRVRHAEPLPTSAIGYGVEASPLAVARAYAGLATGRLPTLGVLAGESRPSVVLAGIDAELALVRRGLSDCVQRGTAKRIEALARFQVYGKTGTAEVGTVEQENNAWFAGFLPWTAQGGTQLAFCAVVYWVPNGEHGADAAGTVVGELLERLDADPELQHRYITPAGAGVGNGNEPRGGR